ncbi:class I adenylate-forming enzyme family protein [Gulosibacter molinativorax]|uniref:O-succinylbenzoate--CoA ligase n=1 Tax=Gulosibacter molinativorax TaxID=256821 RepID=A0ABT7C9I1_9MICO|nr:AMP-binding protein [Gulosibacter molinativorax]MDJ1371876.1 o-succinylbenzoate--CoA ligase [Gulosibacter molinativorax]QUY62525.1 Putative crotonobetaine/carnitine-CoA ligase [Gulosibacter molinativorax]
MTENLADQVITFSQMWDQAVNDHGGRSFLVFRDVDGTTSNWTYSEFDAIVDRAAGKMREYGVGAGDSVHLCLRNSPAFIALWLATSRLGAWMVPADPGAASRDIERHLERVRPMLGFASAERASVYREGAAGANMPVIELTETAVDVIAGGALAGEPLSPAERPLPEPLDRLAIMFTSGTTSEPKGVDVTQANYATVGNVMASAARLSADHRWYVSLPLFHANAQYYCFASAIAVGASVGLAATFSASKWIEIGRELDATHASLFAAPIRMILARTPADTPPLQLEHVWFAQNLAPAHHRQFGELVGTAPRQLYGMTETIAVVTYDSSNQPGSESIGTVTPGRAVSLFDVDNESPVAAGEKGIISVHGVRGIDLFRGYLDDPDTTARSFRTDDAGVEWFSTGDLAVTNDDGTWRFVGRVDDVVKVSGENVSLTEVEAAIAQAQGVLEVAVVTIPDPVRDVVPVAYVVPRDHANPPAVADLECWALTNLAPASRPREWHLIDELPRTSVGKIRRSAIVR